jgi:hypothetical protein
MTALLPQRLAMAFFPIEAPLSANPEQSSEFSISKK